MIGCLISSFLPSFVIQNSLFDIRYSNNERRWQATFLTDDNSAYTAEWARPNPPRTFRQFSAVSLELLGASIPARREWDRITHHPDRDP